MPNQEVFNVIESAIASGNATTLSQYLGSSVELELPGESEGMYSKQQAQMILKRFFEKNAPASFKIVHQGNSATGSRYAVGDFKTKTNKTYRVTVYIKKNGENYLIQEIEFE